jgi:anti-sigma factor RsiW
MNRDQLEFLISQYVDGTLPADEKAALEHLLQSDTEAQQILNEYRSLNTLLQTQLPSLPEMNWDQFATDTSRAISNEDAPVLRMRIFTWNRMAIAASLLLAVTLGMLLNRSAPTNNNPPKLQAIAEVEGPTAQPSTQPAVAQITVGPATEVAESQYPLDNIVFGPSSVSLIASSDEAAQDTHHSPYQR